MDDLFHNLVSSSINRKRRDEDIPMSEYEKQKSSNIHVKVKEKEVDQWKDLDFLSCKKDLRRAKSCSEKDLLENDDQLKSKSLLQYAFFKYLVCQPFILKAMMKQMTRRVIQIFPIWKYF